MGKITHLIPNNDVYSEIEEITGSPAGLSRVNGVRRSSAKTTTYQSHIYQSIEIKFG